MRIGFHGDGVRWKGKLSMSGAMAKKTPHHSARCESGLVLRRIAAAPCIAVSPRGAMPPFQPFARFDVALQGGALPLPA
ncbi:MAG: hypothetical protein H7345_05070 [Rubritepida sp.]|nr:hypothetical protein [Rubritepida sp.]